MRAPKCEVCGKPARGGKNVGTDQPFYACRTCLEMAQSSVEMPMSPMMKKGMDRTIHDRLAIKKSKADFKGRTPTPEQGEILDLAPTLKDGAFMLEAGAGTGKTSTLEMLAQVMEGNGQYTAFNSALVAESEGKFKGTRVACNTTHSLAFRARGKEYAHRLNGKRIKASELADMLSLGDLTLTITNSEGRQTARRLAAGFLAAQVKFAIQKFCQSADPELTLSHFRYLDGIDFPTPEGRRTYENNEKVRRYLLPFAQKMWEDIKDPNGMMPFTHDHYVKIWQLSGPVISADYILLDEAQDTAPVMLDILRQQSCLKILVGDSAQQICEWRGAVNALAAFPEAPRRFLTQSFRFGEAVAEVANAILEELDEPTELRLKGLPSIPSRIDEVEQPHAILCRTNAAAVAKLLGYIAEGKRPFIVGGGGDVKAFMRAAIDLQNGRSTGYQELACFNSWSEVQEYAGQDEGEDLRLMVKLVDKFGADNILKALEAMPQESQADVVISTAHKSKGRQWTTVQLAADFPTRDKCGDAERKLLYVAVTRAQHILDVSRCPYFTGEEGLDVSRILENQPDFSEIEVEPVVPPTPSDPPSMPFTWSRLKDEDCWGIRGPKGYAGQLVEVERRDGSVSKVTLASVAYEFDNGAVYRKA